ncbi:MAG: hypothetical protein ACXVB9_06735 [Bdellovibrionota bacterium]
MQKKTPACLADLYERHLGRAPSEAEEIFWAEFMRTGGTEQEAQEELLITHEFLFELRHRLRGLYRWPVSEEQIEAWRDYFRHGGSLRSLPFQAAPFAARGRYPRQSEKKAA